MSKWYWRALKQNAQGLWEVKYVGPAALSDETMINLIHSAVMMGEHELISCGADAFTGTRHILIGSLIDPRLRWIYETS